MVRPPADRRLLARHEQRLGIAAALLGDPPILVFDEPMNGLDPEGIVWLRGFLRDRAREGRIVLLSSDLMSELEGIADRLVIIKGGRPSRTRPSTSYFGPGRGTVTVRTDHATEAMAVLANNGARVTSTGRDAIEVDGLAPSGSPGWSPAPESDSAASPPVIPRSNRSTWS